MSESNNIDIKYSIILITFISNIVYLGDKNYLFVATIEKL